MTHPTHIDPAKPYYAVRYPAGARARHSADDNDNALFTEARVKALGDAVFSDGDVVDGARPLITYDSAQPTLATVSLGAGKIYARGLVLPVSARTLTVSAVGVVQIGLCVHERTVTYIDDPTLVGAVPGTITYGQPGADRLEITCRWIAAGQEACDGTFVAVYTLRDGILLTKEAADGPWVDLTRRYDRERNGHYKVKGFGVTPLGYDAATKTQTFSIAAGTVNVWGFKIDREFSQRLIVPETPTLLLVENEPHQAPAVVPPAGLRIVLNHGPVVEIVEVTVLKTVTETVTHGAYAGAVDTLSNDSIAEIVSITQAARTYVAGTDYRRVGDTIDWSLAGQEPVPGSSYTVTYRWYDTLAPSELVGHDSGSVTITGATPNTTVQVRYKWALPRTDLIAIDRTGRLMLLAGTAVRYNPWPPQPPLDVLVLAKVENRWGAVPVVTNSRAQALHNNQLVAMQERLEDGLVKIAQLSLYTDIVTRAPSAARGVFVDPLKDDSLRDQGIAQTAAIVGETLRLPISGGPVDRVLGDAPFLLPYTEEVVLAQDLATTARKINEYQVFAPMPGTMVLDPAVDFWTTTVTTWTSDITRVFDMGERAGGGVETDEVVDEIARRELADQTLRVRTITYSIDGFGAGEILDALTFDGVDITP
jgi:hypothetical protein